MNRLIKYIFLILTIIVNNDGYSQEQNYLKTIRIELKNSIGENIENARILIDSVEIKYDILTKGYFGSGQFSNDFTIEVICKGYEKLTYNKKEFPFVQRSTDFVARLYLSKPGDKYYYLTPYFKVPYQPHSDELLVVLKTKESIISENSISQFENRIKKQGLAVYKTFLESPSPNTIEYMKYRSASPSIRKTVIVKKEDDSPFATDSCSELAFLRQLEQVEYAGPLILMNDSYYDAFTYNHFIKLDYPLKNTDGETLNKLLKGIDERYFFDEKNYRIVLPPETNENVPQIMEKIYESGISEPLYMSVMKFKQKQSNIDPKTISQLNSSDSLNDSFIYGGEEVKYYKEWNKIGIVFETGFVDDLYFPFVTKYKLERDQQHQHLTVFRLTESLTLENRKRLMETIKKEKYIKVVGDVLSKSIISDQIIVRWSRGITDSVKQILEEEGLEVVSKEGALIGTVLKVQDPYNYRVIEICKKLMDSGLVIFAEPDLYSQVIKGSSYNSQFKTANIDYYTRGNQKIAFQKKINFIGVTFTNEMSKASILKLVEDWELTIDAVYMNGLFFVLKFPINLSSDSIKTIRESISLFKSVTAVGDILIQTENNLILATQDLIIKWKPQTSESVKQTFIKQYGLTEIRKVSYITGGFQYRIEPNVAYASTDICLNLLEADIVAFAEPVIISTSEDDD